MEHLYRLFATDYSVPITLKLAALAVNNSLKSLVSDRL